MLHRVNFDPALILGLHYANQFGLPCRVILPPGLNPTSASLPLPHPGFSPPTKWFFICWSLWTQSNACRHFTPGLVTAAESSQHDSSPSPLPLGLGSTNTTLPTGIEPLQPRPTQSGQAARPQFSTLCGPAVGGSSLPQPPGQSSEARGGQTAPVSLSEGQEDNPRSALVSGDVVFTSIVNQRPIPSVSPLEGSVQHSIASRPAHNPGPPHGPESAITTTADTPWIAMATARSQPISPTLCRQFLSVNGPVNPSSFLADPTSVPVPSGGREVLRSMLQVMGTQGGRPTAASRAGGAESGTLSQFSSSSNALALLEGCQAKTSLAGGTSVPRTLVSEPSPPKKPKLG